MPTLRAPTRPMLVALTVVLVMAGTARALQSPGRTIVRNAPVRLVALNNASFAFVVARSKRDCDHVELWNTDTKGIWRFGKPGPCANLGSTGTGTTTRKTPRQLRLVAQDVDLPAPFVIGDSTSNLGIPYAAGREVVLLGANGGAVFKVSLCTTMPSSRLPTTAVGAMSIEP